MDSQVDNVAIDVAGNQVRFRSYGADITAAKYPNLDDGIQNMIMRCLAVDPIDRPSLEELLKFLRFKMMTTAPSSYSQLPARGNYETASVMARIVKYLIYDAPH